MMAQIGEVLATYWRRAVSGPLAMVALAMLAVAILGAAAEMLVHTKLIEMEICTAFLGTSLIALHFKQQIIQMHRRRLPNAAPAHLMVVVGFLVLFAVVPPAASLAVGKGSWGALGLILALTAVTFAYFAVQTPWFFLFIIPLVFVACFSPVQKWLEDLCGGRHEVIGWPFLAAGVCGIAATLTWLLHMSEEDIGYFDLMDPKIWSGCGLGTQGAQARTASWLWRLGTPRERQVELWRQWARGPRWQRIRLWALGSYDVFPLWPFAVFFLMVFTGMYVVLPGQRSTTMMFNALFMTFDPVFTVTSTMSQRRQVAAIELLRPVGRSQFFMEMGLAYAYRVPAAWVLFSIAWCVPAYVFTSGTPVWSHQVFNLLVLTAAFQVFFFGLTVWVMRYSVPLMTWTAICCGIYIGMIMGVTALSPVVDWSATSLDALLWASPVIVAAGAIITWDAYRRWLQTEMG